MTTGAFFTDYPRGLDIFIEEGCEIDESEQTPAFSIPHYMGPILFSSDGFPYYGPHHKARVVFPRPLMGHCFRITQTGWAKFDWSVVELRLAGDLPVKENG